MVDSNIKTAEEKIEEIYAILKDSFNQNEGWNGFPTDSAIRLYRLHFIKIYVDKMIYGTSNEEVELMFREWHIPRLIHEGKPDGWEE